MYWYVHGLEYFLLPDQYSQLYTVVFNSQNTAWVHSVFLKIQALQKDSLS
jgi:hypothetical protein